LANEVGDEFVTVRVWAMTHSIAMVWGKAYNGKTLASFFRGLREELAENLETARPSSISGASRNIL